MKKQKQGPRDHRRSSSPGRRPDAPARGLGTGRPTTLSTAYGLRVVSSCAADRHDRFQVFDLDTGTTVDSYLDAADAIDRYMRLARYTRKAAS